MTTPRVCPSCGTEGRGMTTKVTPQNATFRELCAMKRDHVDIGDFSLMTDTNFVWLSEQKIEHDRTQHVKIPRGKFNRLLAWYLGNWGGKRPRKRAMASKGPDQKHTRRMKANIDKPGNAPPGVRSDVGAGRGSRSPK